MRRYVNAAWLAVFLLVACSAPAPSPTPPGNLATLNAGKTGPQVGQAAPGFTLSDETGQTISLADFRGTPVLLNFWATWCEPCKLEMPELEKAQATLGSKVRIVAVDMAESKGQVQAYKTELGLTLTTPIDPRNQVTSAYNIFGLPASYVIDKDGVVRAVKFGPFVDQQQLMKSLAAAGL